MPQFPEASYWLALLQTSTVPRAIAKRTLWRWCVEQGHSLCDLLNMPVADIAQQLGVDAQRAAQLVAVRATVPAHAALIETLGQQGGGVLTRVDPAFPESLTQRLPEERMPYVLFYRGSLAILAESSVAALGGTAPDTTAQDVVRALAGALVAEGYAVLGGYDRGCDRLAQDAARDAGGQATMVLPLGLTQFGKALDAMQDALLGGHVLALSPYGPEAAYSDAHATARWPVLLAMGEAVYLVAPEHGPEAAPALAEARAKGKPVFIWSGANSECTRAWIRVGAVPFAEIAGALDLLVGLGARQPPDPAVLDPPADGGVPSNPSFAGPDEAIKSLAGSGKVPDVLARRLREAKW